jgi:hypothetical protein
LRQLLLFCTRLSPFFSALLEKVGPQDGKLPAYVKKSICLSIASLMDFSKSAVFQGFWKTGLALLVLLGQCQKDGTGLFTPQYERAASNSFKKLF